MYHVSTQGVDESMINVHYYYYLLHDCIKRLGGGGGVVCLLHDSVFVVLGEGGWGWGVVLFVA